MSMEKQKDIDLRAAIPDTPDICRDAVLQAVSTYREEKAMRKPYQMILAAALVLMLLCGTAFAIVNYYSVREFVAQGKTSMAFENHIVPLEKAVTANGLIITLGDAIFDGKDIAFTMNLEAEEGTESLYIFPLLEAFSGDEQLELNNYKAEGFDPDWGFLFPYTDSQLSYNRFGLTAEVQDSPKDNDVTWRYTLHILQPTGKLVEAPDWDSENESFEQWSQHFHNLYARGEIGVYAGYSVTDYLSALNVGGESWMIPDMAVETGMFSKLNTIVFEFTTPVPERTNIIPDETFQFDGYEVLVKSITTGFLQVDYELEIRFDEAYQGHEHDLIFFYRLSDQNGLPLQRRSATLSLADDRMSCKVWGSVERITDEPLSSITFALKHELTPDPNDTAADMPSFTVNIPN